MNISNFNDTIQELNIYFIIIFSVLSTIFVQKLIRGEWK